MTRAITKISLSLFLFLVLFSERVYSLELNIDDNDSLICLEISGKITAQKNEYENDQIKVELIYYNTVIDSIITRFDKKFKFYLMKDSYYTLRISKEGYITKIISVCTALKEFDYKKEFYKFHFDTELIPVLANEILNPEALEFPIAIIAFDEKQNVFYFNERYTLNIKQASFYR